MVVVPTNKLFIPKIKTGISSTLHHSRKRTEKTRTKREKKRKRPQFLTQPDHPPKPLKKSKVAKRKKPTRN
jgi:hypothetical protein